MPTRTITLPPTVYDEQLVGLFQRIPAPGTLEELVFDMRRVRFYIPGAIAGLMAQALAHHSAGCEVRLSNHETCEAFAYLQRIDFFERLGIHIPEAFVRRTEDRRFVPVREIRFSSETTRVCTELTACVSGTTDPWADSYQLVQYALGEVVSNCKQHSGGVGFASAQYFPQRDLARIAVGDGGRGIRESFRVNDSPYYSPQLDDRGSIELALRAEVSSVTHRRSPYGAQSNRGLGLSVLRELVASTLGYLVIISGDGWYQQDGNHPGMFGSLPHGGHYQGTLVSAGFQRSQIADYTAMHNQALRALGLQTEIPSSIRFS